MAFDTRQYEWSDVTVLIGGRDAVGIRGVKYASKQEKEPLHAKGNNPHSIQRGNISYEGEITLTQSELETLTAAGKGSILGLNMDIQVAFGNPSNGDVMITDNLLGCEFTEEAREIKQGDKFMEVTLPFIFLKKDRVV